ncbi:hypothetical protein SG34_014220 [Thalassomonas viridans]|uniref:Uncharacterized protein n=1 Tax=Thalassomonas viridans TaxID=137584 RepID=A0AAE9ZBX3_9GAMM|nr:hypothetical protein [Thalassomonas viridans]WDE08252.1 hypothetical protein SG34_014220 [Thalassomonas viridans]
MTWLNTGCISEKDAFATIALDRQSATDYGLKLPNDYPYHKTQFTQQALAMLSSLNDYDQYEVLKEIVFISANPSTTSSVKHSLNPFNRIYRTKYPFRQYHYLIVYKTTTDNKVVITDVLFDFQLKGSQSTNSAERTMLYQVDRVENGPTYDGAKSQAEIDELPGAWKTPTPTTQIRTEHAAVNGMKNNLNDAAWLMGTHADAAYQTDTIKAYTLFHNPSDNTGLDVIECAFDKRQGTKSHNAQHLAAVLAQRHRQGKATKWVAHSQGVIVFCAALEHYRLHYGDVLQGQQLAVHGSGANINRLTRIAHNLGVKIHQPRNNPFDFVPNIAGGNDLSPSSLVRCLKFSGLVINGSIGGSPHTLPFLGLRTYHKQLTMLGDYKNAARVQKYIDKIQ